MNRAIIRRCDGSNKEFELMSTLHIKAMPIGYFVIPRGFKTDGASVPWYGRGYVKKFGKHLEAAIVHDWLYHNGIGERKTADSIFYKLMLAYGVKPMKAKIMYLAVRIGGKGNFKG